MERLVEVPVAARLPHEGGFGLAQTDAPASVEARQATCYDAEDLEERTRSFSMRRHGSPAVVDPDLDGVPFELGRGVPSCLGGEALDAHRKSAPVRGRGGTAAEDQRERVP